MYQSQAQLPSALPSALRLQRHHQTATALRTSAARTCAPSIWGTVSEIPSARAVTVTRAGWSGPAASIFVPACSILPLLDIKATDVVVDALGDTAIEVVCEEGDLERAVGDGSRLAKQLIEPLLAYGSAALFVNVESVSFARGFTVGEDAERHRCLPWTRSHDEVDVAGVEAEEDSATGAVEDARPTLDRPIPCEGPVV